MMSPEAILLWAIASFGIFYFLASALPGWRSVTVALLPCVVVLHLLRNDDPEGGGLGYVLGVLYILPGWVGAVGGIIVRTLTLWKVPDERRMVFTAACAPIVAIAGYIACGPVLQLASVL